MKHLRTLALVLSFAASVASAQPQAKTVVLAVEDMTCAACPITVRKALEKVPGVASAKVDYAAGTAEVTFDPDRTTPEALVEATTNAGYPSTVKKGKLK